MSDALQARLDALAREWRVSRAAALRRLVMEADVDGAAGEVSTPDMAELTRIASEKARQGSMSAVAWLASRMPTGREAELQRLMRDLGAGAN